MLDTPTLLVEHKNKWIDHVAASTDGKYRAYTTGKEIHVLDAEGQTLATHTAPSSLGGLAFAPNSKRLAASHYNGVSLYWLNAKESAPSKLIWKGSHLGLIWHPDGKMILSSLQEGALHGWRLSDNHEMRMQGYATKVHSLSFTAKGKYLVTSGAEQMIAWPFFGGGPWGKEPLAVGGMDSRLVTRVAAHPKDDLVAVGHEDGMITLAPLDGRMEILIQPPQGREAGIVGLGWNHAGDCLFAALENGMLLLFTVDSVRMAVTGTA